jgi:hypothetical protein
MISQSAPVRAALACAGAHHLEIKIHRNFEFRISELIGSRPPVVMCEPKKTLPIRQAAGES